MELTAEHFQQLVSFGVMEGELSADEQRRQPRISVEAEATVIPLSSLESSGASTISVRDLSCSGIGFLSRRRMALDEQFALLVGQDQDNPAIVLCAVAFWQPLSRDLVATGARFLRVLRDANAPLPIHIEAFTEEDAAAARKLRRSA